MTATRDLDSRPHQWSFFRAGGFDQVRLDKGEDLAALFQLDQKLWSVLACPVTGLEFDAKTLALLDTDKDGRIRATEVINAVTWACRLLKDPGDLLKGSPVLPLDAINVDDAEGATLLAAARRILRSLGKGDATAIGVGDTDDTAKVFAEEKFNGDGIVCADAAEDDATRTAIDDILACGFGALDGSGRAGVNQASLEGFFTQAIAFANWWSRGEGDGTILAVGERTHAAAAAMRSAQAKIDDYFVRCQLASFDPRALGALNREEKDWIALASKDLSAATAELAAFPLARIEPGRPLPLAEGVNPAWAATLAVLRSDAVTPVLGDREALTVADWQALQEGLAAYGAWWSDRTGASVERLGITRVRALLQAGVRADIEALIARDKALEAEANGIAQVDQLVRYHRDLRQLCDNFVSFKDFYGRRDRAIFQAGTLYLDSRACDLCLVVEDMGKHGVMAVLSRSYLAYCECVRKGSGQKMTIAAAFTNGDSDNLMVGRNGVFYDRRGNDWDATIVKIVENPISIRQAFWSPYKRIMRIIEEQIAKRAAAADASSHQKTQVVVVRHADAFDPGKEPAKEPAAPPPPPKSKFDVGTVAALGVAVGGITAALGGLMQAFFGLGLWMPLGVLAIVLFISGGSMIVAWLKLRQRNLGPLLDASGWAVNSKALINIPFGASLTRLAQLPVGAQLDRVDPFAVKKGRRRLVYLALALGVVGLLWWRGSDLWSHQVSNAAGAQTPAKSSALPTVGRPAK